MWTCKSALRVDFDMFQVRCAVITTANSFFIISRANACSSSNSKASTVLNTQSKKRYLATKALICLCSNSGMNWQWSRLRCKTRFTRVFNFFHSIHHSIQIYTILDIFFLKFYIWNITDKSIPVLGVPLLAYPVNRIAGIFSSKTFWL